MTTTETDTEDTITLNCPISGHPVTLPNDTEIVNEFAREGCEECRKERHESQD